MAGPTKTFDLGDPRNTTPWENAALDAMIMGQGAYRQPPRPVWSPQAALRMRLHIDEGDRLPFEHIDICRTAEKFLVFVVRNSEGVVLEDDKTLFPSDTLMAQLALFRNDL